MEEEKNSNSKKIKNASNPKNDENKEKYKAKIESLKNKLMQEKPNSVGMSKSDDHLTVVQKKVDNKSKKNEHQNTKTKETKKGNKLIIEKKVGENTTKDKKKKNQKEENPKRKISKKQDDIDSSKSKIAKEISKFIFKDKKISNKNKITNEISLKNDNRKITKKQILNLKKDEDDEKIEEEEEEEEEEERFQKEEPLSEDEEKIETVKKSDRSDFNIEEEDSTEETNEEDEFGFDNKPPTITKILAHKTDDDDDKIYLVKLNHKPYKNCKWISEGELKSSSPNLYRFYNKSHTEQSTPEPYFNPNFLIPEKIISSKKRDDKTYYLVKWKDLDYVDTTWEDGDECKNDFPELIDKFVKRTNLSLDQLYIPQRPSPQSFKPITHHPCSKSGFQIRQYQLAGINFLANAWYNKRNAILADEMGLGKTAQAVMFLDYLEKKQEIRGPFLIVAPLSTIPHWTREIAEWSDLSQITYCGDSTHRKFLKMYEMFYPNTTIPMFQILLTTYEYVIKADKLLSPIKWRAIIVDEAQRMKNHQSKLFNSFSNYSGDFKLLMTGTPLQNNIEELWTLLNFLDPSAFDNLHKFQENFGDLNEVENIEELQAILKPMMLRRMKSDVEKSISPLEEIIIECPMTPYQRAYYKSIYDKNIEYLNRGAHKGNSTSLNNIVMELRKVCNHPFLINGAESQITIEKKEALNLKENEEPPPNFELDLLVRTAGKMILLDKLLHKLKQDGHRVLIFSQMTKMLDIIQDYLDLSDYKFCRIDGSIRSEERQKNIDNFNKKGSNYFVFLLCTRSGGVGINLASADTVIIFDSDYNPQNDIQATSRCHRIGQKKDVKMYRFITAKSYERKMFDMASIKLGLDHAVLGGGKKDELSKFDIEKLLRFGAYYAYEEEEADNKTAETFGEEDIESVISRSTRIQHASVVGGEGSTFSKAHFEISENEADVDLTAPDFWQKYTPVVQEDEDLDSCSIAERHKKLRERLSLEDLNEKLHSSSSTPSFSKIDEQKSPKTRSRKKEKEDAGSWSLNKANKLILSILRFGWGRWNAIIENTNLSFELRQIIAASHVFLQWLVEASTEGSPIMLSINQTCIENDKSDDEMIEMQKQFIVKNRTAFYPTITSGSNWKLSRLELLYFIDTLVKSAENPPDDIPIPSVATMKPTDWWTSKDDQLLIYNTWKYGFSNYNNEEFKFSQNIAENTKRLTSRLHSLMHNLKLTYASYKTRNKDKNLPFSCEVLKQALNTWSPKDHKSCVDTLVLIGEHPDISKFKEISNLQTKSDESVQEYIKKVIDYCKALKNNEPVDSFDIIEPISITKATKLLNRIIFFSEIRNNKIELKEENDKKLIDYICENGFSNMSTELEWTKNAYELTDLSGFNLIKLVRQIRRKEKKKSSNKSGNQVVRTRIRSTRSNSTVDDYQPNYKVYIDAPFLTKKEDGSYKFPIQVTQKIKLLSIGEVVYDRPYYHNDKYIYPVGYQAEKEFYSIEDPHNQAVYRGSILDGGEHPLFRVECLDNSKKVFEGISPSKPWMEASLAIEASKKKFGLPTKDKVTISGPVAYGFTLPIVTYLIDHLPNAHKCENHIFKKYFIHGEPEDEDDNEPNEGEGVIERRIRRKTTAMNDENNENEEEEEELNDEFDYDENEEDENDENIPIEIDDDEDDENSNDGYSEEESYDDHFDRGNNRTKIKMRRIRVSKKRKDFIPDLHLKFTHLDEFENDLNQKDFNLSFHSSQITKLDPENLSLNHPLKSEKSEDQLKEVIIKLSEKI